MHSARAFSAPDPAAEVTELRIAHARAWRWSERRLSPARKAAAAGGPPRSPARRAGCIASRRGRRARPNRRCPPSLWSRNAATEPWASRSLREASCSSARVVSPSTSAASASISCHRLRSGSATVFGTSSGWRTRHSLEKFPNFATSPTSWKNRSAAMIASSTASIAEALRKDLSKPLARPRMIEPLQVEAQARLGKPAGRAAPPPPARWCAPRRAPRSRWETGSRRVSSRSPPRLPPSSVLSSAKNNVWFTTISFASAAALRASWKKQFPRGPQLRAVQRCASLHTCSQTFICGWKSRSLSVPSRVPSAQLRIASSSSFSEPVKRSPVCSSARRSRSGHR